MSGRRAVLVHKEWALENSGRNPLHLTYREIVTRPWRTWMQP